MSLDRIWQLDAAGPTSNSNFQGARIDEGCAPSGINNSLRALGSMIVREIAFQASAISASVSTNLCTSVSGLVVPVVGAGAVNSWGVVPNEFPDAAVLRIVQFSSSASLSHGGSIFLTGGASRRTQPGDIGGYIHAGSGDTWYELFFSRRDGALAADSISVTTITNRSLSTSTISTVTLNAASASVTNQAFTTINATSISASVVSFGRLNIGAASNVGTVIQTSFTMTQTAGSTTSQIPSDTSAPLFNEGGLAFSIAFTPKVATSMVLIEANIAGGQATTGNDFTVSLFKNGTGANACVACVTQECASNGGLSASLSYAESASSTTLRSYQLRYGASSGDAVLNDTTAGDTMGGRFVSSIKITEFL
jgi:hypothetical protein